MGFRRSLSVVSICMLVIKFPLMRAFPSYRNFRVRFMLQATVRRMTTNPSPRICFNHAGASPSPKSVVDRSVAHLKLEQNIGGYAAANEVADELENVYQSISNLICSKCKNEVALVESATVAFTRAFYSMAEKQLKEKKQKKIEKGVILISDAEYAANVVAASRWAENHGWSVLSIPSTKTNDGASTGIVDLEALKSMLSGNYEYRIGDESFVLDPEQIAIACITHVPTNSGIVNPVQEIGQILQGYNSKHGTDSEPEIFYLVDACQSVGHLSVNVQQIQCHSLVATGRKYIRGPRGTGFLYVSSSIQLSPSHVDHYGVPISHVPPYQDGDAVEAILEYRPRDGASKFEFWESNISNRLGLGVAIRECINTGIKNIEESCASLSFDMRKELQQIPDVVVHHSSSTYCGIVTFYSSTVDSERIVGMLQQQGFELSVVPATSTPIDSAKTKVPDLVRASVSYVTTREEVDQFIESLRSILEC